MIELKDWGIAALKSISDGVITTDLKGTITFMNPVAETLTGWIQGEALGKNLTEVFNIINTETGAQVENLAVKVIQEDLVINQEEDINLIAKADNEIPIANNAAPIKDQNGDIIGAVLTFRNITKRKQAIEALKQSEDKYRESEKRYKRLSEAEREQRLLAETMGEVFLALTSQTNHGAVLTEILYQVQRLVAHSAANIMLVDDEHHTLSVARWRGYESFGSEELLANLKQSLADFPLDAEVIQLKQPIVIPDTQQDSRWVTIAASAWIRSFVAVPICLQDRVLGLLRLDSELPNQFSTKDIERLLPLANAAAIALENAQLLADQAASAIANAQLYEQVKKELAERQQVEKELRWVSARNQTIINAIPDSLFYLNRRGEILDFKAKPNLPLIREELAPGINLSDAFGLSSEYKSQTLHYIEQALDSGEMQTFEFQLLSPEGDQDIEVRLVAQGANEVLAIIRNITKRKQAERTLHESETKFRALAETTSAAIFIYQSNKNRYVNPGGESLTGYTQAELLTLDFWDIIHPDFRELVQERGSARLQGNQELPSRYELKILTKKGEERWLDVTLGLTEYEGKQSVLGTAFDITKPKRAEEALKRSEANLRAIFNSSRQAFILIGRQGEIQAFNKTAMQGAKILSGRTLIEGGSVYELVSEEDLAEFERIFNKVLQGETVSVERLINIDATDTWVEYNYTPVFADDGQVIGVCFSTIDIDARKRALDALTASEEQLLTELQSALFTTEALVSDLNLSNLLELITTQARYLTNSNGAIVLLLDENGQNLEVVHSGILKAGTRLPIQGSPAEFVIRHNEIYISNQALSDERTASVRRLLQPIEVRSLLCTLLKVRNKPQGVLLIWSQDEAAFIGHNTHLIHLFANQVALAIYNANLHIRSRELAIEHERQRLARDLHDTVNKSLFAIGMLAQAALRRFDRNTDLKIQEPIKDIHQLSQTALTEIQKQIHHLQPTTLADKHLNEALEQFCNTLNKQFDLKVELLIDPEIHLSTYQQENLYYIAREALWNVVKHAGDTQAKVVLEGNEGYIILLISDEGSGFVAANLTQADMIGLRSMQERAEILGGSFSLQSEPGSGTRIIVQIPR
jgi:PAS domain S-box-containing protein